MSDLFKLAGDFKRMMCAYTISYMCAGKRIHMQYICKGL